jgi:NAD(P)H-dependent FMN reductase
MTLMADAPLRVQAVVGSLRARSVTRVVLDHVSERLRGHGATVDLLDLSLEPLPLYNPDTAYAEPAFPALQARVESADVYLLGTPDYHGSISAPLKNFLDHFWQEFAGKLFAPLVASHEKGLTAIDQLRTVARQCYAWTLPYGVSFVEKADVNEAEVVNPRVLERLEMFEHDVRVYGELLAGQRRRDLAGAEPGFLARYRK